MVYIREFLRKLQLNYICVPLTILFNRSLNEELLTEDWKRVNVIPIFKKGEISDPGNYQTTVY